jgi:hypothetical protein
VGVNRCFDKFIKIIDVLSIEKEPKMLAKSICQPTFLDGFNIWFGYFCKSNFFIRGCYKLKQMDFDEFTLLSLPINLIF